MTKEENSFQYPKGEFKTVSVSQIKLPQNCSNFKSCLLGSGATAGVYKVILNNGEFGMIEVALKQFWSDTYQTEEESEKIIRRTLEKEAKYVNKLDHVNIVQFFGICYEKPFQGLVFELCNDSFGNLCRIRLKTVKIPIEVLVNWALQIAQGMCHVAEMGLVHRDLKPDNILVKEKVCFCQNFAKEGKCDDCDGYPLNQLTLKITDFGFTRMDVSVKNSASGTHVYMSPEAFKTNFHSEFSDVWSFGVTLWELMAKEWPTVTAFQAMSGERLKLENDWPKKWKYIVKECWKMKHNERPTFKSLVKYFEKYEEIDEEEIENYKEDEKNGESQRLINEDYIVPSTTISGVSSENYQKPKKSKTRKNFNWILLLVVFIMIGILMTILAFFLKSADERADSFPSTTKEPAIIVPQRQCPPNHSYFHKTKSCYIAHTVFMPFVFAEYLCTENNSHLSSIHSKEENEFIVDLYQNALISVDQSISSSNLTRIWLGLKYNKEVKSWKWTDSSSLDYSNWAVENPIHSDYLFYITTTNNSSGTWNYESKIRSPTAGFVCKFLNNIPF